MASLKRRGTNPIIDTEFQPLSGRSIPNGVLRASVRPHV